VLVNLAGALGLDSGELFLLAHPQAETMIFVKPKAKPDSPWEEFKTDKNTRKVHGITQKEMDFLSRVAMVGKVRSPLDFIFILKTIRNAVGQ